LLGAIEIAERIRSNIESMAIMNDDGIAMKVTVSIGVTSQIPVQNSCINEFISNADKALYAAKDAGRNKVLSIPSAMKQ